MVNRCAARNPRLKGTGCACLETAASAEPFFKQAKVTKMTANPTIPRTLQALPVADEAQHSASRDDEVVVQPDGKDKNFGAEEERQNEKALEQAKGGMTARSVLRAISLGGLSGLPRRKVGLERHKSAPLQSKGALVKPLAYGFFLRLPRNMRSVPESSASALPAEPTLISGTAPMAKADAPIKSRMIPNVFCIIPQTKPSRESLVSTLARIFSPWVLFNDGQSYRPIAGLVPSLSEHGPLSKPVHFAHLGVFTGSTWRENAPSLLANCGRSRSQSGCATRPAVLDRLQRQVAQVSAASGWTG